MKTSEDEKWMRIALAEALRGAGLTAPNPPVGAVIVKEGVELSRGWHRKAGSPHAEREALSKLEIGGARGATAYVTLEPCSTSGRTGACTDALIQAGVSRVVYGARDPNPNHVGRANNLLKDAGVEVGSGVLVRECEKVVRGFAMVQTEGRPWVIAKTAMSLDGRITRPPGEGQWLSGGEAREEVQLLRAGVDAIITSGETLRRDDPALTLRSEKVSKEKGQPKRVVLTRGPIDRSKYQIFNDKHGKESLVYENIPMYDVLRRLAQEQSITMVLLEAGGSLLGSFLDQDLIDEWIIYLAPIVSGGPTSAVGGEGAFNLADRMSLIDIEIDEIGNDLRARGFTNREGVLRLER